MTLEQIQAMLELTGIPVAYNFMSQEFIERNGIKLPWIAWRVESENNFSADNVVFSSAHRVVAELFCESREPLTEALIESVLKTNDIFFTKDFEYLYDEKMYGIQYNFEV